MAIDSGLPRPTGKDTSRAATKATSPAFAETVLATTISWPIATKAPLVVVILPPPATSDMAFAESPENRITPVPARNSASEYVASKSSVDRTRLPPLKLPSLPNTMPAGLMSQTEILFWLTMVPSMLDWVAMTTRLRTENGVTASPLTNARVSPLATLNESHSTIRLELLRSTFRSFGAGVIVAPPSPPTETTGRFCAGAGDVNIAASVAAMAILHVVDKPCWAQRDDLKISHSSQLFESV